MSIYDIQQYHEKLEKINYDDGSKIETAIRNFFNNLLNEYAHSKDLIRIAEFLQKINPENVLHLIWLR